MDFSEQDVDVFGEDYNNNNSNNHDDSHESFSSHSSSSSSSASSSSSTSSSPNGSGGSESSSAIGNATSGEEVGNVNANNYDYNNNNSEEGIYEDEEEDERDLFGSDNEDYCKTPATSPLSTPGILLPLLMPRTRLTSKVCYGEHNRTVLGKKRKNTTTPSLFKKMRVEGSGEVPLVPKNWDDSIIKDGGEDCFWEAVRAKQVDRHPCASSGYHWDSICNEAVPDRRCSIPGTSVLKFRFERGEFPLSITKFGSNSLWVQGWDEWVNKVLKNSTYVTALNNARVLDAIRVTTKLRIRRESRIEVWRAILARWSTFSHTMVTAWGEFTFTLEDVCILLELPCIGRNDYRSVTLSKEEEKVKEFFINLFRSQVKASKVVRFSNWVGLFYKKFNIKGESSPPRYPDHIHELVALLIMWLARYVFPGCPNDGISYSVIPYAIKIAKGMSFPLAPLYLGSLYRRLDLYHSKTAKSVGRYGVLTYVDVSFIQMCLWERFRSCAPTSNVYQPPVSSFANIALRDNYRAWAWHDQISKDNILKVLDEADQFIARPYVRSNHGFGDPTVYYDRRPFETGKLSSRGLNFVVWVHSFQLPSMIETTSSGVDRDSLSVEVYSPYRVARQFGYDQPAPPRPNFLENFSSCTSLFLIGMLNHTVDKFKNCVVPAFDRIGAYTAGWYAYWGDCLQEWTSFVIPDPVVQLHIPSISNNDVSLRLIRSKRNKTLCQEKSISNAEVEGQDILESESEEESCDHMNNHKSSDESIEKRFPRHEHQSLRREVDGNTIQGGLIDMTDFLPSTIQNVSGNEVNDITRVSDGDVDAATRIGDDDVGAATRVGGDDVNAINQNDQSAFGFGTFQHNNANIIAGGTFGIDATHGATRNIFSFEGVPNVSDDAFSLDGVSDSTHNSSSSLREHRDDASDTHLEDFHGIPVMPQHLQLLEHVYKIEGEFWHFKHKFLNKGIMDSLGTALEIASSPWVDISFEELQKMVGLMDDVLLSGCHIKCLDVCMAKAKEYIMTKVDEPIIEAEIKELDARKMELQGRLASLSKFKNDKSSCPLNFILN